MIKLKNLLKEFEYGKSLFTDPMDPSIDKKSNFISLLDTFNLIKEPNTDDEKNFLKALSDFFNMSMSKSIDVSILKHILTLKSKFPAVLDPTKSSESLAYRGTTIGIDKLVNMNFNKTGNDLYEVNNPNITLQSKGSSGYLSFSNNYIKANSFSQGRGTGRESLRELVPSGMFPILIGIDINTPNLLFNPSFSNIVSTFDESETILVDTQCTPKIIFLNEPLELLDRIDKFSETSDTKNLLYNTFKEKLSKI